MAYFAVRYAVIGFACVFLAAAVFVAASVFAQEEGVVFPVAELGGCQNKAECKAYCDEPVYINACVDFALEHNLMDAEEAARARTFARALAEDAGPGGCRSPEVCKAYCENITHLDECLAFADRAGYVDDDIGEAKRIAAHLRAGGSTPGNCTSERQCEAYCSEFAHIEECLRFAEEVGLEIEDGHGGYVDKTHIRKIAELMERDETPGGCRSRQECEAYCFSGDHVEECVAFGLAAGFMSPEEAEILRKTSGKGPGGCASKDGCETFCSSPENRIECVRFAREHGFLSEEEISQMEEGLAQFERMIDEAPPELLACLRNNLGENVIEKIRNGELTPGPAMGEKVRMCAEHVFGPPPSPEEFEQKFSDTPPEVRVCIESELGADFFENPTALREVDPRHVFDRCFREPGGPPPGEFGEPAGEPYSGEEYTAYPEKEEMFKEDVFERDYAFDIDMLFSQLPEEVRPCVRSRLGTNIEERVARGELAPAEIRSTIEGCMHEVFESFAPPPDGPTDIYFDEESGPAYGEEGMESVRGGGVTGLLANVFAIFLELLSVK